MTPIALITDFPWLDVEVERAVLEASGIAVASGTPKAGTAAEIEALVRSTNPNAILTCWAPVSAAAIGLPGELKIVARMGVGLDNIDVAAATRRGAIVTNVPDYCVNEVADHTTCLVLNLCRGAVAFDRDVKQGRWESGSAKLLRLAELTVGIIGVGRIGRATAGRLAAFGCRILGHDQPNVALPDVVTRSSLAQIQEQADVIVLHVPLSKETHHLVDDAFIGKLARAPVIVNTSRGGLIDNAALIRGLDEGRIRAAALDVIEGEPNPPREITLRQDVIVTPHVAYLSTSSLIELRRRAAEEVARVLTGKAPLFPCN